MPENNIEQNILVFSKTEGFRHSSIEAGQAAIQQLGLNNNVNVELTEDASLFNEETLSGLDAVIFLNTTGTVLDDDQKAAFKEFIQNGGGYTGIHSATDTEYDWPWYNGLAGAYFNGHPPGTPNAVLDVVDGSHSTTEMLPARWERVDEWYNFRDINEDINVLINIDKETFEGSKHTGDHPVAWYHEYDGGRAFYTALGHTEESFSEDLYLQHLWNGIEYAMGAE
ncbi:MAG: ThuA domain-containing protein [Balneolales bacterium]